MLCVQLKGTTRRATEIDAKLKKFHAETRGSHQSGRVERERYTVVGSDPFASAKGWALLPFWEEKAQPLYDMLVGV